MSTVQPIRDITKLNAMKGLLLSQSVRDYTMFTLGVNSGLRISDLLSLTLNDVYRDGKLVYEIKITESKTDKKKSFQLGKKTQKALNDYIKSIEDFQPSDPLFFSRKKEDGMKRAISRQHAHYVLSEAAKDVGINDAVGTHTLRKTFGYHAYKKGTDLALLQEMLNHSSQKTTLRYIGITKEEKDRVYVGLDL